MVGRTDQWAGFDVAETHREGLLLQAHELLARFAARHELIPSADAAQTEKELLRLRRKLEVVT